MVLLRCDDTRADLVKDPGYHNVVKFMADAAGVTGAVSMTRVAIALWDSRMIINVARCRHPAESPRPDAWNQCVYDHRGPAGRILCVQEAAACDAGRWILPCWPYQ